MCSFEVLLIWHVFTFASGWYMAKHQGSTVFMIRSFHLFQMQTKITRKLKVKIHYKIITSPESLKFKKYAKIMLGQAGYELSRLQLPRFYLQC